MIWLWLEAFWPESGHPSILLRASRSSDCLEELLQHACDGVDVTASCGLASRTPSGEKTRIPQTHHKKGPPLAGHVACRELVEEKQ